MTQAEKATVKEYLRENEERGFIKKSKSPWASPMFFIEKVDKGLRPVVDYWRVNDWTVKDQYPLPRINALLNDLYGLTLMTKFDVWDGYYNIRWTQQQNT